MVHHEPGQLIDGIISVDDLVIKALVLFFFQHLIEIYDLVQNELFIQLFLLFLIGIFLSSCTILFLLSSRLKGLVLLM